ncbi:unnamed protein product [Zymoseptoria tritici ST99CH_1E4]|uniref:F-box domain-containing protein n=1 Tax=Zymoseptoria tritici ST99CH_1E4 TaxID=1276532 RepID=A0A2H1GLG0_ZYMTR|nr:unnamed protein product [Zymoseptoria tritici ST99CH_1E4]
MSPNAPMPEALSGLCYSKPNIKDWTLDEHDLENTCPLDIGRHNTNPQQALGALEKLPLELLSYALAQLDISTLMGFRRVNQRAMQVIDSIPQFRTITCHDLSALRGVISIQAGGYITCQELYDAMSASLCVECNDFAGFIYLLDCTRVCFNCFTEKDRYLPLTPAEASRSFGIDRNSVISTSRQMTSVPGCYSSHEKQCNTRLLLVDEASARMAGGALHGSASAMEDFVARSASEKLSKYQERFSDRADGQHGPRARRPARLGSLANPRLAFAKRFMAVVRAPSASSPEALPDWGFHCLGCRKHYHTLQMHWRRKFNVSTFDDHILECGSVVDASLETFFFS